MAVAPNAYCGMCPSGWSMKGRRPGCVSGRRLKASVISETH